MSKLKIKKKNIKLYFSFLISYIIIATLLSFSYYNEYAFWKSGDITPNDIVSSSFLQMKDSWKSSQIGVGKDILNAKNKSFEDFLNTIDEYFSSLKLDPSQHIFPEEKIDEIRLIVNELLLTAFNKTKNSKSLRDIFDYFYNDLELVNGLSSEEKDKIKKIIVKLSSKFYPQKKLKLISSTFTPRKSSIKPGEVVIKGGTKLTNKDLKLLRKLHVKKKNIPIFNFVSLFLLSFIIYLLFFFYFLLFAKEFLKNLKKVYLLLTILIFGVLLGVVILPTYFYIFPMPFFAIIIAISINLNIGIAYVFTLTLLLSFIIGGKIFYFITIMMLSGITSVFLVNNPKGRSVFTKTGVVVGTLNFFLIIFLDIYKFNFSIATAKIALLGFFTGFFSPIMVLGILPIIEDIFTISTSIKLLELSDPSHPLLKRLLDEAPGTYQHSAIVSNLAVAAASTIGADPLLARAGGFYHDIGKLKRPYLFIENQMSNKNIHDEIQPTLSTLAIISHVKDGVELAKRYNLPEEVINIIREHHGTSLVSYFYFQAIKKPSKKDELSEEDFRYPGPKPQSKEAAIVMLADAVEAASRTLTNPTATKIKNFIKSIIQKIVDDGQLEESPLTFRDINLIEETFEKFLLSLFHTRIEYPKIKQKE